MHNTWTWSSDVGKRGLVAVFVVAAGVKVGRGRNNSFSLRDSASLFQCPRPYSQSPLSVSRGLWPDRLNKCQRLFPRKFDTLYTGEPRPFTMLLFPPPLPPSQSSLYELIPTRPRNYEPGTRYCMYRMGGNVRILLPSFSNV